MFQLKSQKLVSQPERKKKNRCFQTLANVIFIQLYVKRCQKSPLTSMDRLNYCCCCKHLITGYGSLSLSPSLALAKTNTHTTATQSCVYGQTLIPRYTHCPGQLKNTFPPSLSLFPVRIQLFNLNAVEHHLLCISILNCVYIYPLSPSIHLFFNIFAPFLSLVPKPLVLSVVIVSQILSPLSQLWR